MVKDAWQDVSFVSTTLSLLKPKAMLLGAVYDLWIDLLGKRGVNK